MSKLLAAVWDSACEAVALRHTVEAMARAMSAQGCAVMSDAGPMIERGFGATGDALGDLAAARAAGARTATLGGDGPQQLCFADAGHGAGVWLAASRSGEPFTHGERDRLLTIAGTLSITLARLSGDETSTAPQLAGGDSAERALHDPLTGLPHRVLMRNRAGRMLRRALATENQIMAALIVGVDDFEALEQALGDRVAGRLLVQVAERLRAIVAHGDGPARGLDVGRHGAAEFVLLTEPLAREDDIVVITRAVRSAFADPFHADGREITLTASVGAACTTSLGDRSEPIDAGTFLAEAESALARARQLGGDRSEIADERIRARLRDRAALEAELRAGLRRGELRLLFQPVVTVADAEMAAVEALVRWQHPARGLLGPGEFIPLAEHSELIVELGTWVIEEACAQIARWRDSHPARLGVRVSVNVSARQLSPQLVDAVSGALARHGVEPSQLALEITESMLVQRTEDVRALLAELKSTGVAIVLDDFGTGFSSLGYLRDLPLDQLKLDRLFCTELEQDLRAAKLVAATIEMARALGMTVVAEGVETSEQLTVLRRLGCDFAQGFWFARPQPPEAVFERLIAAYESDSRLAAGGETPLALPPAAPPTTAERADVYERRTRTPGRRAEDQKVADLAARAMVLDASDPTSDGYPEHMQSLGRMVGVLYMIGSVIAIPGDLVMHSPSVLRVALLTTMGLLSGAIVLALPWRRLSPRWLHVVAAIGTIEVTTSVVSVGSHATVLEPFYPMIAAAVAYGFRSRRAVAAHTALIIAAMLLAPILLPDQPVDALARALVGITVLVSIVVVIVYLRERLHTSARALRMLADRDPLTEIGNYRVLHERLGHELARHRRAGEALAVLLIDLDRFKQVNERLGHAAGDDVLRRVARTLRDAVRNQDTVARQGGDEFAVLAPDTDADGAAMLAERLRQRLRRLQFAGEPVDATIGWAVYPADGDTADALLAHADARLLGDKHTADRQSLTQG